VPVIVWDVTGGAKFLEGQTITLEDGSTAVVQAITGQSESYGRLAPLPHYACLTLTVEIFFKHFKTLL